jgi:hypothetical protein
MTALLLASVPALPLDEAGKYVAGAYVVFLALIVVYVAIMAAKLQRIERELRELAGFAESRKGAEGFPEDQAAPGRGSEESSVSESLTPHGSGGGGA